MYTVLYPWLFALLPLPFLLRFLLPAYRESRQALRAPWFARIAELLNLKPGAEVVKAIKPLEAFILLLLWGLLVIALARPQYFEPPLSKIIPTRDLLLVVDLSGSMESEDFTNVAGQLDDRLTAVKEVLAEFLERRQGDRVGLVVFGSAPFVQVPFTQDLAACQQLLDETAVRMAGPRTVFGDAIGLGITLFEESDTEERVMIALTDGNDTASRIPPLEAAKIAADNNIIIHVVGVGDPTLASEGKLDEASLSMVAQTTGGRYFHAADRLQLEQIYDELDQLGSKELEVETYRPQIELFHWPLAAFMLIGLLYGAVIMARNLREDL